MHLLLVEDDLGIGRFLQRGLLAEGYAVEWQQAGEPAYAALASRRYAAAILDLGLPDMDGVDLCRRARGAGIDTPICMLTARTTLEDRLAGFDSGADDYLCKPFAFAELLARLAVMLRRNAAVPARLVVGALALDPIARQATVAGVAIDLTPREFALLHCLVDHAGSAVSRDLLIDRVWGAHAAVTENIVDVYVGYLRRRFADHPDAPALLTVRGVGFAIRERAG
ncbi:response regulator transcription factor [Sphingomonas sp. 37zxx]|uniref:response regulator transcription factor n=1 Tax=Sphingomonas sp. 37zxx TaxID=1550073 RepID=UPI00053BE8D4|nr:response regulator transcription factor [Sphingomonas sp. 37zxx]